MLLSEKSTCQSLEVIKNPNEFCFTRAQAEKIYECVRIKDQLRLEMLAKQDPIVTDNSLLNYGLVGASGFVLGIIFSYYLRK